jgi:NAD(P)-dependent dehydrogenase (short-subunit alcohol dehydrogenase family)
MRLTYPQGYTRFSNFADLSAPTAADWDTCFAVNVRAQTHLLHAALATFNANPDGGSFIVTSSIAGIRPGGSSMPYSVTKAAQLHLMRCLAATQGPKVRVNAVLPGLLLTEWGQLYGEERIRRLEERAWLKKVVGFSF